MQEHKITIPKTAHYYTLNEIGPNTKNFWIVCHGYGQLASAFIHKFEILNPIENFIVAPEGLSRFYWKLGGNQVAACWMTRQNRLDEIADYSNYIKTLYDHFLPQLPTDVQIILMGFSQGCATQCRWIMEKLPRFDQLILWGGFIPEDLDYTPQLNFFKNKKLHFICGDEDQFITTERRKGHEELIKEKGLEISQTVFEGKHEVPRETLLKFFDSIK